MQKWLTSSDTHILGGGRVIPLEEAMDSFGVHLTGDDKIDRLKRYRFLRKGLGYPREVARQMLA